MSMSERSRQHPAIGHRDPDVDDFRSFPDYPAVPWPLFGLFLLYVLAHYLQFGQRLEIFATIRFEFLLGIVLAATSIPLYFRRKDRASVPVGFWAVILFCVFILMVPMSISPAQSWNVFFNHVFKFSLLTIFISTLVVSPRHLKWFLGAWLLSFAKMAQEGIFGLLDGTMIWENQGVYRLHGATSVYQHPNSFAGTQLGTIPFLYEFFLYARSKFRFLFVIQWVMAFVVIIFCASRTSYLAFFVWLAFLIARAKSRFRIVFVLVCIGMLFSPLIPDQYIDRLQTVVSQQDAEGASIDTRKQILIDAWEIFLDKPFGVGVGAFPIERENRYGRNQDTHNLYLEIATNLGVIGLVVFFGFILSMLRTLRRLEQSFDRNRHILSAAGENPQVSPTLKASIHEHDRDLYFMSIVCKAVIAFVIIRLAVGFFGHDLYAIYWWFCLGLTIALANLALVAERKTEWITERLSGTAGANP